MEIGKPLKILLVEDNPGDARLLGIGLTEDTGDEFQLDCVQSLASAIERLPEAPDAILLDLNLPDSQGLDTLLAMRDAAEDIPVLVLTGLEDEELGLRAIQRGAQDYLSKSDLSGATVGRALRYAVERHHTLVKQIRQLHKVRRGRIVAFIGAKGGVGASTVVLNAAALTLRSTRRTVTAVELRGDYGSFAANLREEPTHGLGTLLKLDANSLTESVLEKCITSTRLGFDILFSPQQEREFGSLDQERALGVVELVAQRSAFTYLDLPSRLAASTRAVVQACDLVVLVSERDAASLAAAKATVSFLTAGRQASTPIGLVLVNRSTVLESVSPRQVEQTLGVELLGVVPPAPEVAVSAYRYGMPLALHRPNSAPASMLDQITSRILARLESSQLGQPRLALA